MRRRKERRRNEGKQVNEEIKIAFWNIAGLKKKRNKVLGLHREIRHN